MRLDLDVGTHLRLVNPVVLRLSSRQYDTLLHQLARDYSSVSASIPHEWDDRFATVLRLRASGLMTLMSRLTAARYAENSAGNG